MEKKALCHSCKNENCFLKIALPDCEDLINSQKGMLRLTKGAKIIQKGNIVGGIYFVYEGKAKVFYEEKDGMGMIFRFVKDGDILGHRGYGGPMVYPISASTLVDSKVCFIRNEVFFEILNTSPQFTYKMMMFFAEELRRLEDRVRIMSKLDGKNKMAYALLQLYGSFGFEEDGKTLAITISRKEMAGIIGTVSEVVSRLLNALKKEGLVILEGKRVIIPDLKKLKELVIV